MTPLSMKSFCTLFLVPLLNNDMYEVARQSQDGRTALEGCKTKHPARAQTDLGSTGVAL